MQPIEIIVLIAAISIVLGVLGRYIYKKIKGMPTGECSCCKSSMKGTLKKISKELEKERKCDCGCNK